MRAINDREWSQFVAKKGGQDFFVAVVTTGIFCRTGCPARTPKRENVRVFSCAIDAAAAGFRPCQKCKPLGPDEDVTRVVKLARAIEEDPAAVWDGMAMAEITGVSQRSTLRKFRQVLGLSPRAFRDAVRLRRFKSGLKAGDGVTNAGFDAGYGGAASRHEASKGLGMTATQYASGGAGELIESLTAETALGTMVIGATARGICYLQFCDTGDPIEDLRAEFPNAEHVVAAPNSTVRAFLDAVAAFLEAGGPRPDLPVDLYGTAFQIKVWEALREIPASETRTYGGLASDIGHPGAARAVGSANAKNRVAVLVPCHLVVAAGGKLGGYSSGLDRKRKLLALEGPAMA